MDHNKASRNVYKCDNCQTQLNDCADIPASVSAICDNCFKNLQNSSKTIINLAVLLAENNISLIDRR